MKGSMALAGAAGLIGFALVLQPGSARPVQRDQHYADTFERGVCASRVGCLWYLQQRVNGIVRAEPVAGRRGLALHALAGPKRGKTVAKAALVARIAPAGEGSVIRVSFDMMVPQGRPGNSLQLVDLECADCGWSHNPGVRLYLRHGRLRIDRSKIDVARAWVNDDGPQMVHGRWHRVAYEMRVSTGADGWARAYIDGTEVVSGTGRTLMLQRMESIDRVQVGLTANSNPEPAELWIDNVRIDVIAPAGKVGDAARALD